jgi:hypothetical protein
MTSSPTIMNTMMMSMINKEAASSLDTIFFFWEYHEYDKIELSNISQLDGVKIHHLVDLP